MKMLGAADRIIPIDADVWCMDGKYGQSTGVLVNPFYDKVVEIVVRSATNPHNVFIVPLATMADSSNGIIRLSCTSTELERMEPFIKTELMEDKWSSSYPASFGASSYGYGSGAYMFWPYALPIAPLVIEHQQIPAGELFIRRRTSIEATDGRVGHVDELQVHLDTGHITHIVMREGHLWGQRDVSIPIKAIREMHDRSIFLQLNRQQVEALPVIPIRRGVPQVA